MSHRLCADFLLLAYSFVMGVTSVILKLATQELEIFNFMALRFVLAFAVSVIFFRNSFIKGFNNIVFIHVVILGLVTFLAHVTCTYGVSVCPVSVAGFLTSLQPVAIPLLALVFMKRSFMRSTVICVVGAAVSVCIITAGNNIQYGPGVWSCLSSSVLAGLQVLLMEKYLSNGDDAVALTVGSLGVMAVCAVLLALATCGIRLPSSLPGYVCILWTGIISTAVATYVQAYAQRYTSAVHTGIIFASIPVFTLIGGVLFFKETFSLRAIIGSVMLIACIVFMELSSNAKIEMQDGGGA